MYYAYDSTVRRFEYKKYINVRFYAYHIPINAYKFT